MYTTCIFCNGPLGANEVVEHFPVGRRLAFDPDRGRLWVVCPGCERWNLSPLEERWEALEECERIFRDTRMRVSTEEIGLARHAEGLELVRIGRPQRPEFAAWRYGDQFGRRRRNAMAFGALSVVGALGLMTVGPALVGGSGAGAFLVYSAWDSVAAYRARVRLRTEDGGVIKLKRDDLPTTRLRPAEGGDGFRLGILRGRKQRWFEGEEAARFAAQIVPRLNRSGGRRGVVRTAVREIEDAGHPDRFLDELVRRDAFGGWRRQPGHVNKMPTPTRLALEMALHEEEERRALEGDLARLERAWREAEEIAAISDSLLLPRGVGAFIARHRVARRGS